MTMSHDTDESPVKPTVIDLDAEDVVSDDATPPAADEPRGKRTAWPLYGAVAALLAGLVAGGWLYRDVLSSYFPSDGLSDATARIATLEQQTRTIAEQSASDTAALRKSVEDGGKTVADAQAATAGYGERLSAFEQKLASLTDQVKELESRPQAVPQSTGGAADASAVASLSVRIAALEKDVAVLKSAKPSVPAASSAPLKQSLADLSARIAAGAPYKSELDQLQQLVPAAAGLEDLRAFAQNGVPTAQGLADEMEKLAQALPKSATPTEAEPGYFDGVWRALSGFITIRRVGEADWAALASRIAEATRASDLQGALAMIDDARGERPPGIEQWRQRAAGRLRIDAALQQASSSVARQVAGMGGQP
jgi:hypothetical protein